MAEFHDWQDVRAELDDGAANALAEERARTEAWVSAFQSAQARRAERLRDLQSANHRRLAEQGVAVEHLPDLISQEHKGREERTSPLRRTRRQHDESS